MSICHSYAKFGFFGTRMLISPRIFWL